MYYHYETKIKLFLIIKLVLLPFGKRKLCCRTHIYFKVDIFYFSKMNNFFNRVGAVAAAGVLPPDHRAPVVL